MFNDHRFRSFAHAALRIVAGCAYFSHGAQKLFGWFGGYGLGGTAQYMDSIGLSPGIVLASLAGGAEFFGGLALLLGLLVRPAAVALAFTMLVAIFSVHISKGLFLSNGGFEYGLALLAVTAALVISGAGRFSLDRALARNVSPAHS
jgi:putative oxidoreductase